MLALCSPTANAAWFVLGPGLEKNHSPPPEKSSFLKISGECPQSKWGGGAMSSSQACIAAEDTVVLQQRGGEGM